MGLADGGEEGREGEGVVEQFDRHRVMSSSPHHVGIELSSSACRNLQSIHRVRFSAIFGASSNSSVSQPTSVKGYRLSVFRKLPNLNGPLASASVQ